MDEEGGKDVCSGKKGSGMREGSTGSGAFEAFECGKMVVG